jgi:hypothetical protein
MVRALSLRFTSCAFIFVTIKHSLITIIHMIERIEVSGTSVWIIITEVGGRFQCSYSLEPPGETNKGKLLRYVSGDVYTFSTKAHAIEHVKNYVQRNLSLLR